MKAGVIQDSVHLRRAQNLSSLQKFVTRGELGLLWGIARALLARVAQVQEDEGQEGFGGNHDTPILHTVQEVPL